MFTRPSYISFLLCGALLTCMISSCTSENQGDIIREDSGSEVSFDVSDGSRSSANTIFNEFAVYGDMQFEGNTPTIIFDKTKVELINDVWSYQGTQYWFPRHEHTFVGVCPLSVLEIGNPQYTNSCLTFIYTLPTKEGDFVNNSEVADIMTATHRRLYGDLNSDNGDAMPVNFQFSHLMSMINFSIGLDEGASQDAIYEIQKLSMTGFGTSATISIKPAALLSGKQTNDSEIGIVLTADCASNGQLSVVYDEPLELTYGNEVKMFEDNNAIIMLPQKFEENAELKIDLTYSKKNGEETTQVSAILRGFEWQSGRCHNYKFTLVPQEEEKDVLLTISSNIEPWKDIEHTGVDAR